MKVNRLYGIFDKGSDKHQAGSVYDKELLAPCLDTMEGGYRQPMIEENSKLRIRKLTPKECARLMAFTDKDFEAMASVNSDSQIYKQCGNSIVVNVLMAIFEEMLPHEQKDESITDSEDIVEKPVLWGGYWRHEK